jgi:tetratricopeptide (TPR) repeat protein
MNADKSDRTLTMLLESSFEDPADGRMPGPDVTVLELPSLDQRVDAYVQAVYGLERVNDEALRALARQRILEVMARDLADGPSSPEFSTRIEQASGLRQSLGNSVPAAASSGFIGSIIAPLRRLQSSVVSLLGPDSFSMRGNRLAMGSVAALLIIGSVSVLTVMPGRFAPNELPGAGIPAAPAPSGGVVPTRSIPEADVSAEADLRRQILNLEMKVGPSHTDVVPPLISLAKLLRSQNRYREAEALYRRALEIQEHTPDAPKPVYAQTLRELAELYRAQGRTDQADRLLQKTP